MKVYETGDAYVQEAVFVILDICLASRAVCHFALDYFVV